MNKWLQVLIATALITGCSKKVVYQPLPTGPNTLTATEHVMGWELLFDGSSLHQWKSYGQDGVHGWGIKEGELTTLGNQEESMDLMTRATFDNFELRLEWKLPPKGNSGIMFYVQENANLAPWEMGPEYQLIDESGYDPPLELWQTSGANYAMHNPAMQASLPIGEYNTSRLIVEDGYVQHWLNDRLVVKYQLWTEDWEQRKMSGKWKDYPNYGKYKSGHIVLQDHDSPVSFRNIKIRRL